MILVTKNDNTPVMVGQIIPTFFGKLGQVIGVKKPVGRNKGSITFFDCHGDQKRTMTPNFLNLEFVGN